MPPPHKKGFMTPIEPEKVVEKKFNEDGIYLFVCGGDCQKVLQPGRDIGFIPGKMKTRVDPIIVTFNMRQFVLNKTWAKAHRFYDENGTFRTLTVAEAFAMIQERAKEDRDFRLMEGTGIIVPLEDKKWCEAVLKAYNRQSRPGVEESGRDGRS